MLLLTLFLDLYFWFEVQILVRLGEGDLFCRLQVVHLLPQAIRLSERCRRYDFLHQV